MVDHIGMDILAIAGLHLGLLPSTTDPQYQENPLLEALPYT